MSYLKNIQNVDTQLFSAILDLGESKILDKLFLVLSRSADGIYYFLTGILFFLYNKPVGFRIFLSLLIGFAINLPVYYLIKNKIQRKRPFYIYPISKKIDPPDEFSFPSGHTAGAFLVATVLSWFFPVWATLLFFWATLVGFSRVHLRVHYPGDVLAGMCLGIVSAYISIYSLGAF